MCDWRLFILICFFLQNMAFLPVAVFGDAIFIGDEMVIISDLRLLFGDSDELIVEMLLQ